MDSLTGEGDPQQRFRIYRLCACEECDGTGKVEDAWLVGPDGDERTGRVRCDECRGEGRLKQLVATAADEGGVGQALVQNAREGAFDECPIGLLDTQGEVGRKWLVTPWTPSPRNVSDAGRVLAQSKGERNERMAPTRTEDGGDNG
jgi:hypothetical protein